MNQTAIKETETTTAVDMQLPDPLAPIQEMVQTCIQC
jgi:hypothetical protein